MLIFILCVVCFCCLVSAGVCVLRVFCFSFVFRRLDVCLQDIIMRLTCNSMQFPLDILIEFNLPVFCVPRFCGADFVFVSCFFVVVVVECTSYLLRCYCCYSV